MEFLISLLYDGVKEVLLRSGASIEAKRRIVDALERAIANTEYHIQHTRENGADKASIDLYNYWNTLATEIEPYDKERAEIFRMKSKYWKDPSFWLSQIKEGRIKRNLSTSLKNVKLDYWNLKTRWK